MSAFRTKRTSPTCCSMSACDPKRTFGLTCPSCLGMTHNRHCGLRGKRLCLALLGEDPRSRRARLRYFHWASRMGRSTSMTRDSVDPPASFARRYRLSIALGVLVVVAVIMGLRLWLDHLAEQ